MPLLDTVTDAVSNTNFKYKAEIGTDQIIALREEAGAHWSATNKIREAYLLRGTRDFAETNVLEAMASQQERTGNSVAETQSNVGLTAMLVAALGQMLGKQGNNAPPQTGTTKP